MSAFFSRFFQNKLVTLWEIGRKASWLLCRKLAKQVGYFVGNLFATNLAENVKLQPENLLAKKWESYWESGIGIFSVRVTGGSQSS